MYNFYDDILPFGESENQCRSQSHIPGMLETSLSLAALELPHAILERERMREEHERQMEMTRLETQIRLDIANNLWRW